MPASTSRYSLPYQLPADPPDGAALGLNLATATETALALYGSKPICRAVQQTNQTGLASGATVAITFGTGSEVVDLPGMHNEASNTTRFIPTRPGWYRVDVVGVAEFNTSITSCNVAVLKNGSVYARSGNQRPASTAINVGNTMSTLVNVNGTTDYLEGAISCATSAGTWNTNSSPASSVQVTFERDLV